MEVKPGFKQTEVGLIPEEWNVARLGDVCAMKSGEGITSAGIDEFSKYPCYGGNGLRGFTSRFTHSGSYALIGRQGALCGNVFGVDGAFFASEHAIVVTAFLQIDIRWLTYLLGDMNLNQYSESSAQPGLSVAKLKSLDLAIPPTKGEQGAIAEVLCDVDALLGALDRLIAKKSDLKQAAMQQLLTGQTRLPGFHDAWEVKRIGDIASPSSNKNGVGETLPVLTCSKHLGFMDSLGFFKNQIFSNDLSTYKIIKRGQIGYPANHVEEGSIGLQHLYDVALVSPIYVVFSVDEDVNSFFLHRVLKLNSYRHKFKTATTSSVDRRGSLRWPAFSQITVSLPKMAEQDSIAQVLSEMDAELASLEQQRDKTRALKQGMMQELLTGRTRLVSPVGSVVPLPQAEATATPKPAHNWQINEAVIIGALTLQFGTEEWPLPRKRRVKLTYLLHRRVEGKAEGYVKKAAGPYNPKTKYEGPEAIALKNGYVREHSNGNYVGLVAAEKIAQAEQYFAQWYPGAKKWLEQFHFEKTDELELLATVDMAMEDLRSRGQAVALKAVKEVICTHPEWEAKLSRPIFSDSNIKRAIGVCSNLFAS